MLLRSGKLLKYRRIPATACRCPDEIQYTQRVSNIATLTVALGVLAGVVYGILTHIMHIDTSPVTKYIL